MIFDCYESSLVAQLLLVLTISEYLIQCHEEDLPAGYVERGRVYR